MRNGASTCSSSSRKRRSTRIKAARDASPLFPGEISHCRRNAWPGSSKRISTRLLTYRTTHGSRVLTDAKANARQAQHLTTSSRTYKQSIHSLRPWKRMTMYRPPMASSSLLWATRTRNCIQSKMTTRCSIVDDVVHEICIKGRAMGSSRREGRQPGRKQRRSRQCRRRSRSSRKECSR